MITWLFGLSGSGKTTIAKELQKKHDVFVLDGDDLRDGLNKDLGFSMKDRKENLRRASEVAKILSQTKPVIACFITPTQELRQMVKEITDATMVYVDTPIEICIYRDVKGLYKLAKQGKIKKFTGISQKFEKCTGYDYRINTALTPEETAEELWKLIG